MGKRNCRRTDTEREQHERATRVRKLTDAQLCEYLDGLAAPPPPAGPSVGEIINKFIDSLAIRSDTGLRISDATIRKIRAMAEENGYFQPGNM